MDKQLTNGVLGIVRSADGETRLFRRRGVIDLFDLLTAQPDFLHGASVTDKVIGRGAALLLVKGGAREVHAQTISTGALQVLRNAGISATFGTETPYIKNRTGDGQCPVETLTASTDDPDEAYNRINDFINNKRQ